MSPAESKIIPELAGPIRIGTGPNAVSLPNRVCLAPMSGVSDLPFRRIADRAGAGLVVSEMVASRELTLGSRESKLRMEGAGLSVHAVQLAGREPDWMAAGARLAERSGAHLIDINMGCPAKKVVGGLGGSALMRDLDLATRIVAAVVAAVSVPVTLKMRLGWDRGSTNATELARRAENEGVAMLTVHGRTRCQFYEGSADWNAVRAVREATSVPLVVNGDIETEADCRRALTLSGADAVMVGRASYGRPWWPGALAGVTASNEREAVDLAREHYEAMLSHYGVHRGMRHARKHVGWYLERAGVPADRRAAILRSDDPEFVMAALRLTDADTQLAA